MKHFRLVIIAFLFAMLSACAQVGLQPPQSFNEKVAYSITTVTSIRASAANALEAKTISAEDAKKTLQSTDNARSLLDDALALNKTSGEASAAGKLAQASSILVELQQFLISKGVK